MKLNFLKTLAVFIIGFCLFVFTYHTHQAGRIQDAVNEHAKIVAGSVWELNPKVSVEYLRAVAANNNYDYIVVKDVDGSAFIEVKQPPVNAFESKLIRLKLIPQVTVESSVFYNNELLGKVEALWLDKSIYVYAYAFLVAMLLFVVVQLYSRVLKAKATLEKKVEERTRNLTEKTDALQESERKMRAIFNQTLQFIGLLDANGILLEANQTPLLTWGVKASDVINKPFWDAPWFENPPELKQKIQQYLKKAAQGRIVRQEIEHVGPDGKPIYIDFSLKPIFDAEGKVVLMIPEGRDITDLRSAQEDLRYSEELHRITIGSILDPVFITDDSGSFIYICENVPQILGYSFNEIQAMKNIRSLVGNDLFRLDALKKSGEIRNVETNIVGKDGKKHYFLTNIKYVSIKSGTILYTFHEISELKTVHDALKTSEKSYRTLAENLPGLVYRLFLAENNRMQFFNEMLEPMTGYEEAELSSGAIFSFADGILDADRKRIITAVEKAIKEKTLFDVEYRFLHKSGSIKYFHEQGRPVFDEAGKPLYVDGAIFDITANKTAVQKQQELEGQLRQAQKLEALGALAGGITHDFNNILSSIYGYTQLALMELPDDSIVRTYLNNMYDAANRAKELVKQILTFSRQETQKQSPIEVHVIVKEALKLLRASIPATIDIRQNIPRCGNVLANPTQIHQILMNLCTNAYHAMREAGGVLSVSLTQLNMVAGDVINGVALPAGPYLQLEVSDTGHGMDQKMLERIFEPYFTTKARGDGTGMGLSVVHGIVKSHGGHIAVSSQPGRGTTFHVYWPVIEQSAFQAEMPVFADSFPGGNENILLIDDEDATLRTQAAILKKLGYQVFSFSAPAAALERFRTQPNLFDLVITDMTMPVMTGVDLSRELMAVRPGVPIVLCTGYSEIISEAKAKEIGIRAFVMKPVEIKEFAVLLRTMLDEVREKRSEAN